MLQSELNRIGQILVASIAMLPAKKWPYHDMPFAHAAANQAFMGNTLAAKFRITTGTLGLQSHEFREMRTLLHSATLISYDSQDQNLFNVRITPRTAKNLFARNQTTADEMEQAEALILDHWLEANGQPWVSIL